MAVSEYYSDEELISQLKMFFDEEERFNIDFQACLGQITEVDEETLSVTIKGRIFEFDKEMCGVDEV